MNACDQDIQVLNYISSEDVKNLFEKKYRATLQSVDVLTYQFDDALLCALNGSILFRLFEFISALYEVIFLKRQKSIFPTRFFVLSSLTLIFMIMSLVVMVFDYIFAWTKLNAIAYFYTALCWLALYLTVGKAKKEWMDKNLNE